MRQTDAVLGVRDPGGESSGQTDSEPVLRVRDVHKRFGRLEVLRGVDFDLQPGEILALVGANGAGKSTVVQCIAGITPCDSGTVELAVGPSTSETSGVHDLGVAVVWQDLALCNNLSVVENLFLGDEHIDRLLLDEGAMIGESKRLFTRLQLSLSDLQRPVGELSGGQRQLVAIARGPGATQRC